MAIRTINLEEGMPTVEAARMRMNQGLRTAKMGGARLVKLIHGYGSSGRGGAIRRDVHAQLALKCRRGEIGGFVPGEDFSAFDETSRRMVDLDPSIARDIDYGRQNHGITMVLL